MPAPMTITTRAKTKKKQEQARSERKDDDSWQDEQFWTRLNSQLFDTREYMKSHEDFMYQIFGHRDDDKLLDFKQYRNYQESDNVISTAIKLFKIEDNQGIKMI